MPPQCHACPDGTAILGLTEMPAKLASGELYILFKKLASIEAAQRMVAERPHLPERSVAATLVAPLAQADYPADVVVLIAEPEQMMWMCMSASFFTGKRFEFHVSGYNAQCVETTFIRTRLVISISRLAVMAAARVRMWAITSCSWEFRLRECLNLSKVSSGLAKRRLLIRETRSISSRLHSL